MQTSRDKEITSVKLLTFPKILGYGFNPLSVYFCYNSQYILTYSIFEVRNTFGDIHHYILNATNKSEVKQKVLKKLFVSPFYTNKGYYNLKANYVKNNIITSVEYVMNNKAVAKYGLGTMNAMNAGGLSTSSTTNNSTNNNATSISVSVDRSGKSEYGAQTTSYNKDDIVIGGTNLSGGNNKDVEKKLDAILAAIQAGGDVYIDGNKAGRAMVLGTQNFS